MADLANEFVLGHKPTVQCGRLRKLPSLQVGREVGLETTALKRANPADAVLRGGLQNLPVAKNPAEDACSPKPDQSTGVYWIPLYDILEERGFEVIWSMRGTPRICRDARAMCRRASGC